MDRELARRKPAKRPHGEIVGAAVVDGKEGVADGRKVSFHRQYDGVLVFFVR